MNNEGGSLNFVAGMDTSQLQTEANKARTALQEIGNTATTEGAKMDKAFVEASASTTNSFVKTTVSIKEQITQQRQLIREITGDIKNLTLAAADASGSKKTDLLGDLKGAKRALAEEQATMIGLQRQQIDANGKEAESQGGLLAGLGKWAIGIASVAGAMKIGHSIMESTEATTHVLEQGIAGAEAATSYFFKTIASGDWSNFFEGMNAAVKGAIDFVDAMEDIDNRLNEQKIKGSEIDKEIATLRAGTFDKSKENNQAVIDNLGKIVVLEREKFAVEAKTAKDTYDIALAKTALTNKTDKDHLDNLISEYTKNKELIELGEEYNKLKGVKLVAASSGQFNSNMGNAAQYDEAQAKLKTLGAEAEAAGKMAAEFAKVTFKERDNLADLKSKAIALEGMAVNGARRDESQLAAAKNKKKTDDEAAAKKAKEDAELDNRIKATQELLKKASDSERDAIAKRLVLLEAEKKLIEWKNSAATAMAANKPIEAKGASTALQAIRDMAKAGGIDLEKPKVKDSDIEVDKIKKGNEAREKQANDLKKKYRIDEKKDNKDLANEFYDVADAAGALANAIGDSNTGLAGMLSSVASVGGQMGKLAETGAFSKEGSTMTKGQGISAGIGAASQIMGIIIGQAAENKKAQEAWNAAIADGVHQAAMLKIETYAYKEANLFGVENPYSRAIAGAKQYGAAMGEMESAAKKLEGGQVQVGTKKVVSGANVAGAAGAGVMGAVAVGAAIGMATGPIGMVIGAAIGGLIGLFAAKKTVPVFESLKKHYGEIYNKDTFELNPKILADYNKLDATTKQMVDNWKEIKAAAKAAQDEMIANFKTLAGDLGSSLSDSIIKAFRSGELDNAISDFHTKVGDVIADLIYQMLFAQFMQPFFDKAQEGFQNSMGMITDANTGKLRQMTDKEKTAKDATGKLIADGDITDNIIVLADDTTKGVDALNAAMTDADKVLKDKGFANGLGGSAGATDNSMAGKISASITENTATELVGRVNMMTIDIKETILIGKASAVSLLSIAANTLRTADNTERLANIESTLKSIDGKTSASRI